MKGQRTYKPTAEQKKLYSETVSSYPSVDYDKPLKELRGMSVNDYEEHRAKTFNSYK